MKCVVFFIVSMLCCVSIAKTHNAVGILTKPVDEDDPKKGSFVGATIVHYLEEQGLYVVPLRYDMDSDSLAQLLPKLSGVLFTGGGTDLVKGQPYYDTAKAVFDYAVSQGDINRPFPIFGVCLGYELLSILAADDATVLETGFDAYDYALPLKFTADAASSVMFGGAPSALMNAFQKENITLNDHECGISPSTFTTNARLKKMFTVLSTNVDRKGRAFVSTIEARDSARYPFFATQWHPECASWLCFSGVDVYNNLNGMEGALWVMRPFAQAARNSENAFPSTEELFKARIENYPSTYDIDYGDTTWYFDQWVKP